MRKRVSSEQEKSKSGENTTQSRADLSLIVKQPGIAREPVEAEVARACQRPEHTAKNVSAERPCQPDCLILRFLLFLYSSPLPQLSKKALHLHSKESSFIWSG